jgi:5-deoxy-5-amino-3-dehydroquinate synthase
MAKYHFLGGEGLMDLPLDERVARCVRIKAEIVARDPTEGGDRAVLNYGHTLAHALETSGRYDLRHGEAVAIGLCFAARLARRMERIGDERVDEHDRVVEGYGLPTAIEDDQDPAELVALMRRDKKALDGLTFVLDGSRGPEIVTGVDIDLVTKTIDEVRR